MKQAMQSYFEKLDHLYQQCLGTGPTVPWGAEMDQSLFVSGPDDDGEALWRPVPGCPLKQVGNQPLCPELAMLFGGWYYLQLRGDYMGMHLDFSPISGPATATRIAQAALEDGNYYFPKKNMVLLATCEMDGNDDLLLFYGLDTCQLMVYDQDKQRGMNLSCTLTQLIGQMEATL